VSIPFESSKTRFIRNAIRYCFDYSMRRLRPFDRFLKTASRERPLAEHRFDSYFEWNDGNRRTPLGKPLRNDVRFPLPSADGRSSGRTEPGRANEAADKVFRDGPGRRRRRWRWTGRPAGRIYGDRGHPKGSLASAGGHVYFSLSRSPCPPAPPPPTHPGRGDTLDVRYTYGRRKTCHVRGPPFTTSGVRASCAGETTTCIFRRGARINPQHTVFSRLLRTAVDRYPATDAREVSEMRLRFVSPTYAGPFSFRFSNCPVPPDSYCCRLACSE